MTCTREIFLIISSMNEQSKGFSPSSGLIDALSDEIGREGVLKLTPVLKRVVHLGIGHTATLKPAVEDLQDPLELPLPTAGRDGQAVNTATHTHTHTHTHLSEASAALWL